MLNDLLYKTIKILIFSLFPYMLLRTLLHRPQLPTSRLIQMTAHLSNGALNGTSNGDFAGVSLQDLPKSNVFTSKLPPDPEYKTPSASHNASREDLGPRMVKGALYTFVRPEKTPDPELLGVSPAAMRDIGLRSGEEDTTDFKALVAGNKIYWDPQTEKGIYPWAQCYGGYQFGSWAGQLGDGRAISLFESTNPATSTRYEIQLKGAGRTPYSRFADGKAVLRSSIREFIVSEALNALHIPSTRALSLTLAPKARVRRERIEPGAIVARFAQSWLRIGTFDLLRARGDRKLLRTLATYVAEEVYSGWTSLPSILPEPASTTSTATIKPSRDVPPEKTEGEGLGAENRFARLYREIVRRNALTVAYWQAYAFTNGVLNTDNTSLLGLSLDFGPFAFLDNFDPSYTPNHDDHALRYSYRNQPSIIWWNLVRLGESFGELIGAGADVDGEQFINKGVSKELAPELIRRAETIIERVGEEYKAVFLAEYTRLMRLRFGLLSEDPKDFDAIFSEALDTMEALQLDFNHFFRRLCDVRVRDLATEEQRKKIAHKFFHAEGVTGLGNNEEKARTRIAAWLETWRDRVRKDWGDDGDERREAAMKKVNPKFIPRSWVLDELIQRVEHGGERKVISQVMEMALNPFEDEWETGDKEQEERFCGDVPRQNRQMMCSCSS
ncbi:MAG: hypothetical protein L6R39_002151 [Caloplaca ligustica]|nr:MAG: hypothetical protein L6R39_002151 [Caloplaca ligustica]